MANSGPVVVASDQSNVPIAQPDATATVSIAANATSSGSCTTNGGAGTYIVQLTGTWTAVLQVQVTRDGTTWVNITGSSQVFIPATGGYTNNIAANGIYVVSVPGVVGARVITTSYTSGTVGGTAALVAAPVGAIASQQGLTWSVNLLPRAIASGNSLHTSSITTTVTQVKSSAGQVYGWSIHNPNAAISYVQFFNTANGSVTLGTTTPVISLGVPANGTLQGEFPMGLAFSTAINVACTTTRAGLTAPGSSVDLNIFYT